MTLQADLCSRFSSYGTLTMSTAHQTLGLLATAQKKNPKTQKTKTLIPEQLMAKASHRDVIESRFLVLKGLALTKRNS